MQINKRNHKSGFSLIELSVVLVIIAFVLYATISAGLVQIEMASYNQTKSKLAKIDDAITLYFKTYGSIPCPASGTTLSSDSTFGYEGKTGNLPNTKTADGTECGNKNLVSVNNTTLPDIYIGVVPVKSLGLPVDYMYDAWGNRITYVVSRYCVSPQNWQTSTSTYVNKYICSKDGDTTGTLANPNLSKGGRIGLVSRVLWLNPNITNTQTFSGPVHEDDSAPVGMAYVTISHGKNEYGAYNKAGSKIVGVSTLGASEKANGNLDGTTGAYLTNGNTTVNYHNIANNNGAVAANYFDDLLSYRTPMQIYYDANN